MQGETWKGKSLGLRGLVLRCQEGSTPVSSYRVWKTRANGNMSQLPPAETLWKGPHLSDKTEERWSGGAPMTEAKEKSCIPGIGNQPVGGFQPPSGPFLKVTHTRRHSSIQGLPKAQRSLRLRFVKTNGGDMLVCCGTFTGLRTRVDATESVEYIPLVATLLSAGIR